YCGRLLIVFSKNRSGQSVGQQVKLRRPLAQTCYDRGCRLFRIPTSNVKLEAMSKIEYKPISLFSFIIQLNLILLPCTALTLSPDSPRELRHSSLPLFRPPNSKELTAAAASKQAIVWSAHQTNDAFLVIANGSTVALACLLDGGDGESASQLELSWSVDDASTGLQRRHTLTAQAGSGSGQQKFSFDLGPGFAPARGVFRKSEGSVLTLAFSKPTLDRSALVIACHLRLGGAVVASSARVRLWDERPARSALIDSQGSSSLPCRRIMQRQQNLLQFVALDCDLMPSPTLSVAALPLHTAVYALYNCSNPAVASPWLQSNSSDPASFYAVYFAGRLRLGWTGDWSPAKICISADAQLPSGQRLFLRWRIQVSTIENRTDVATSAFIPERISHDPAVLSIDLYDDPPITHALPCPFLCLAASADDPNCKFSWLQGQNASTWSEAVKPPDPALGSLVEPHRLLLLPWKPPGNPGPPPLAGLWTCRSAASLVGTASATLSPQAFSVRIAARPSLCGNRPPSRSVVFVPPPRSRKLWSDRQSLSFNCTVCGLDLLSESSAASTVTQLRLHGSLGGVETSTETHSCLFLAGVSSLACVLLRFV
ncbi:hypothetical protein BOX15_Mlig004133g3, partial [Macrostomum lignano]